jgi:hypothetical protein
MKRLKTPKIKIVERVPSTFEEAYRHERYGQYLKTDDDQRRLAQNLIDVYWTSGIETRLKRGKINPKRLIATQSFVDEEEYRLITKLMDRGEYNTGAVIEIHPHYVPGMGLVIDGHNRSKWNALHDVEMADVYMILFPHHDEHQTGFYKAAMQLIENGKYLMAEDMPVLRGHGKNHYSLFIF